MKILYASLRYDPTNPDLGSSLDYECYNAFVNNGHHVDVIGPLGLPTSLIERAEIKLWQVYKGITKKSGLKFPLTTAYRASDLLAKAVKTYKPDVVFSIYPPFFVFTKVDTPCVWYFDTTFIGQEQDWPLYGKFALKLSVLEEKKALRHTQKSVTRSEWSRDIIISEYGIDGSKIGVVPVAATIPGFAVENQNWADINKTIELPLKLLLVGRVFQRKGIDIAVDVVDQLNLAGLPTELIVCGINDKNVHSPFVKFVGPYKKSDPEQLQKYIDLYKWAHLLIHPARFEAAGIVPSEAAAFGTPTITNNTGGLATSVKDGVSGIVLPKGSPASAYVQAITELVNDPKRYQQLCRTTRERYERELNWNVTGKQLIAILEEAIREHKAQSQ